MREKSFGRRVVEQEPEESISEITRINLITVANVDLFAVNFYDSRFCVESSPKSFREKFPEMEIMIPFKVDYFYS